MIFAGATPAQLAEACGAAPGWACEQVLDATGSVGLAKAVDFVVARPLKIALIFVAAWAIHHVIRRAIKRFVVRLQAEAEGRAAAAAGPSRGLQRAATLGSVLRSVASFLVYGLAGLIALGELSINLGPLIAGAGVAGVALGFGAQSLVKDFLSGMFMLIEDQYGVGDVVDLGEASGKVEAVSLRVTRVRDTYGTVWHVPNGEIRRVGNKSQNWSRAVVDVPVAYAADLARAKAVILGTAQSLAADDAWQDKFLEPPELLGVESMRAEGMTVRLLAKVVPLEQWNIERELRARLKAALDEAGIQAPPPPAFPPPPPPR